jgi:hypothetical protein
MSRLFITPREINFINDLGKEIIKDVIGQKIYLFPISEVKTKIHDVYEEAVDKIFDNPIEVDCAVNWQPEEITSTRFGSEEYWTIDVYVQYRDLLDKGIVIEQGDFFSYGEIFFEIIKAPVSSTIYGEIEHSGYITLTGKQSRKGQFISKIFGPTDEAYSDKDAVQEVFVQQRGFARNRLGKTGDIRDLQRNDVLTKPITGPAEVAPIGSTPKKAGSAFYGKDD